jgi:hypothetical protein
MSSENQKPTDVAGMVGTVTEKVEGFGQAVAAEAKEAAEGMKADVAEASKVIAEQSHIVGEAVKKQVRTVKATAKKAAKRARKAVRATTAAARKAVRGKKRPARKPARRVARKPKGKHRR